MQVMFSRGRGGLERVFIEHAQLLAQRGHIVHCLILERAECIPELAQLAEQSNGSVVLHIGPTKGWQRLVLPWTLRQLIKSIAPQVIVSHGAKATSRLQLLRPKSTPLFAVTHNYSKRLMKATHLIALTECSERMYAGQGFPVSRIYKIPNPLPAASAGLQLRPRLETGGPLKIGTLSRLVEKKGIDIFLRGLRIAFDRGLNAQVFIGGDGPQQIELRQLSDSLGLQAHVVFCGWIDEPTDFYSKLDCLCIPSRCEPFGLVALEAFAHGVPVLASDVGGLREIVRDGINGLLFSNKDENALADVLLKASMDRSQFTLFRNAAYADLQQYQPGHIAKQIESALLAGIEAMTP